MRTRDPDSLSDLADSPHFNLVPSDEVGVASLSQEPICADDFDAQQMTITVEIENDIPRSWTLDYNLLHRFSIRYGIDDVAIRGIYFVIILNLIR